MTRQFSPERVEKFKEIDRLVEMGAKKTKLFSNTAEQMSYYRWKQSQKREALQQKLTQTTFPSSTQAPPQNDKILNAPPQKEKPCLTKPEPPPPELDFSSAPWWDRVSPSAKTIFTQMVREGYKCKTSFQVKLIMFCLSRLEPRVFGVEHMRATRWPGISGPKPGPLRQLPQSRTRACGNQDVGAGSGPGNPE